MQVEEKFQEELTVDKAKYDRLMQDKLDMEAAYDARITSFEARQAKEVRRLGVLCCVGGRTVWCGGGLHAPVRVSTGFLTSRALISSTLPCPSTHTTHTHAYTHIHVRLHAYTHTMIRIHTHTSLHTFAHPTCGHAHTYYYSPAAGGA